MHHSSLIYRRCGGRGGRRSCRRAQESAAAAAMLRSHPTPSNTRHQTATSRRKAPAASASPRRTRIARSASGQLKHRCTVYPGGLSPRPVTAGPEPKWPKQSNQGSRTRTHTHTHTPPRTARVGPKNKLAVSSRCPPSSQYLQPHHRARQLTSSPSSPSFLSILPLTSSDPILPVRQLVPRLLLPLIPFPFHH